MFSLPVSKQTINTRDHPLSSLLFNFLEQQMNTELVKGKLFIQVTEKCNGLNIRRLKCLVLVGELQIAKKMVKQGPQRHSFPFKM